MLTLSTDGSAAADVHAMNHSRRGGKALLVATHRIWLFAERPHPRGVKEEPTRPEDQTSQNVQRRALLLQAARLARRVELSSSRPRQYRRHQCHQTP